MRKWFISLVAMISIVIAGQVAGAQAAQPRCGDQDRECRKFAKFSESGQYDRIVDSVESGKTYSDTSKKIIGQAYLMKAGQEGNTPEQEEQYCRKALEFGATSAYMGLYFIYADHDEEAALGFLRQYVETKPKDPVPYVILGDAELAKKHYEAADRYLRQAKQVAHGTSTNLAWLSFQASYLRGDYAYASEMLGTAVSQPGFGKKLEDLSTDPRFSGIEQRPEFKKYAPLFTDKQPRTSSRL